VIASPGLKISSRQTTLLPSSPMWRRGIVEIAGPERAPFNEIALAI
jgi:hypothetical protein